MALRTRTMLNGERRIIRTTNKISPPTYLTEPAPTVSVQEPVRTPYIPDYVKATMATRPAGYKGIWHWQDYYSKTPISCMRKAPDNPPDLVTPAVCYPNPAEIARRKAAGEVLRLPSLVVDAKDGNGETVQVTVDQNGEPMAIDKKPNLLPLALAAGAAWFFLM